MNIFVTVLLMAMTQIVGCLLLNDNGGLNKNPPSLLAGLAASLLCAFFAVEQFGIPAGIFVYLGFVSTVGMLFSLFGFGRKVKP